MEKASRSRPVSRVGGRAVENARPPPRYALTRRKGRPASMLHFVKHAKLAKRDLYTGTTSLFGSASHLACLQPHHI